jgi:outer membrane receptor protein involved in Fe transport
MPASNGAVPMKFTKLLSATALASAAFALPQVAWAQATGAPTQEEQDEQAAEEEAEQAGQSIVVTGSRIARPTLDSSVPVTTVTPGELTSGGTVVLGDALNELPALRSTYSTGNSTRFIGTAGLNLLDLRGLGITRTLVLVNGRRHVTASPGDFLVDVNMIPSDLVERVDVVTGGNSAIYGSDAVAGVVNFVLRRNYDGIAIKGQGGISERGDRGSYFLSGVGGKNFADGRGNVTVALEYGKTNPLYFVDRDEITGAFSGRCQFNTTDNTVGEPPTGDGIPDQTFNCGTLNNALSDGGTVGTFADGRAIRFNPDGTLSIRTPDRFFGTFNPGFVVGGGGSTLRNTGQLAAGVERYQANLIARYEVSEGLTPFVEATFGRVNAIQEGQPSFQQGSIPAFFGGGSNIRCNNAFLTAQALGVLQSVGLCAAPTTGTFNVARFNVDFGGRGELIQRDTYRLVGGIEGRFNDDWRYELSVNYGRLEVEQESLNNLRLFDLDGNIDGYLLAIQAVNAPAGFSGSNFATGPTGNRVICAVNATAAGNVRPDCVPINIFGLNQPSQAALDFVNTNARREGFAEQVVINGFVSGDSSQLFELPGGPIQFALGGEYRTERAGNRWDELTASGGTFLNALQPFDPPTFEVVEAFGEIRIPILRDLPFAELLSIEAAGRVSDYSKAVESVGTVYAWNVSGIYAPVPDFRVRGNYSTSVRAPTLSDLYSPLSENFAFIADPCDINNIGNNPNRAANCAAAGVPATANAALVAACTGSPTPVAIGDPFINCTARAFSTGFVGGGNPTLTEEKGKSWTVGAVFTPTFAPGLSLTVDYYNIEVEQLIATLGAQVIINQCYDAPGGIDNPFCATVSRDPATGLFVEPAVIAGGINFARQITEGIDFDVAYNRSFENGHRLNLRGIATYTMRKDNFVSPSDPNFSDRQLSELGDPEWAFNASAFYDFGQWDAQWTVRYIGKSTIGAYENYFSHQGRPPLNEDLTAERFYPETFYHNARIGVDMRRDARFYIGVDNLFDTKPPFGLLGTAGGDPYNTIGRFFYAGFNVKL